MKLTDIKDPKLRQRIDDSIAQELAKMSGMRKVVESVSKPATTQRSDNTGHRRSKSGYNVDVALAYFKEMRLPEPTPEYQFAKDIGRKWRFDFTFLRWHGKDYIKVALECEGGVWQNGRHTRGSGFVKDMDKYNEAACRGWRIIRCQPKDLCTQESIRNNTMKITFDDIAKTAQVFDALSAAQTIEIGE